MALGACLLPLVATGIASLHAVSHPARHADPAATATPAAPSGKARTVAKVAGTLTTPGHVYVANSTAKTLSQYTAGATGGLVGMTPVTLSTEPYVPGELELNPSGHNLYISLIDANGAGDRIGQFKVGSDGALTAMTPASVPTAAGPIEIVPTPDGKFLYVENRGAGLVSEYSIAATGELSPLAIGTPPVSTVAPPGGPGELTMSPNGKFLYVAGASAISQFGIDAATGELSPLVPATAGDGGTDMKITADGKFLYISGLGIGQYSIGAGGQLTALTPAVVADGIRTLELEVTSSGKFLYGTVITSGFKGEIAPFSVGAGGQLTALTPAMAPAGTIASEAVISPDDRFVYAGDVNIATPPGSDNVSQFSIDPAGTLTPLEPPSVDTGAGAGALAATPSTAIPVLPTAPIPTTTTYTGASTGMVGQVAPLSAKLTIAGTSTPLAAMPVHLVLNGLEGCTATTKIDGSVACSITPKEKAGTYPVTATFSGTPIYAASSGSARLLLHTTTSQVVTPSAVTVPPTTAAPTTAPPTTAPVPAATTPPLPTVPDLALTGTSDHLELAGLALLVLALLGMAALHRTASKT